MKFGLKGICGFLFFTLINLVIIIAKFSQVYNNESYSVSLITNINLYSLIINFSIIISFFAYLFFSIILSKDLSRSYNYNTAGFGIVGIIVGVFFVIDILFAFTFYSGVDTVERLFLILSFVSFILVSNLYFKVLKSNFVYYLLLSPVVLILIRLIRVFSGNISNEKIAFIFYSVIYLSFMLMFLHLSFKAIIFGFDKVNKVLVIFSGFVGSSFALFGGLPYLFNYFLKGGSFSGNTYVFSDLGLAIYSIFFLYSTFFRKIPR